MIVAGVMTSYLREFAALPTPIIEPPKRLRTVRFKLYPPNYRVDPSLEAIIDFDPTVCKVILELPDGRLRYSYLTKTRPYCRDYEG